MLACRAIEKTYRSGESATRALDPIDLEIDSGEFVSIVGPSGCGKSTLLAIAAGIEMPTGGDVTLDGRSISGLPGSVAYMPQRDLLLPWLRALDNAALPLEIRGWARGRARERAHDLFARFGLQGFERHWPRELSGGMRQRVALLRTFLVGSGAILLDEPFGALDALTRGALQLWLQQVWLDRKGTILLVTHDVDEALFLSDRVLVMSERPGRIVREVRPHFARPRDLAVYGEPTFGVLKASLLDALAGSFRS